MATDPRRVFDRSRARFLESLLLILGWAAASPALAQEIELRALFRQDPPAPSLAVGYEVVPGWPRLSDPNDDSAAWGAMSALTVDGEGRIWTLNRGKTPVQIFDAAGNRLSAWGEGEFQKPHGIGLDPDGSVWITDTGLHVARKYSPDGNRLLSLGTPGEAGDDTSHFNQPTDVAVAPDGTTYVSDGYGNDRIVVFDRDGRYVKSWGTLGHEPGRFHLPHAVALDSQGRVYVADRSNARIQVFDPRGAFLGEWRNLVTPWDLWISADDEIFVCGSSPMRWPKGPQVIPLGVPPKDQFVMKLDASGRVLELWTFALGGGQAGSLDWVHAIAIDTQGNLYLGDIQGQRAQKFRRLTPETVAERPSPAARP
jgi:sugar lactone lactonase YvrE